MIQPEPASPLPAPSVRPWRKFGKAIVVAVLLAAPVAAHLAMLAGAGTGVAGGVLLLQAGCVTWVMLSISRAPAVTPVWMRLVAAAMVIVAMALVWWRMADGLVMASAIPHAISYAGLLTFFALSLAPGREPVIGMAARRVRGVLSPPLVRYTRGLTVAWCMFFAAQLAGSLALGLLVAWSVVSPGVWSQFVNLWNMPLVLGMFVAEFAVRRVVMSRHAPSRFIDGLRAMRRVTPGGR